MFGRFPRSADCLGRASYPTAHFPALALMNRLSFVTIQQNSEGKGARDSMASFQRYPRRRNCILITSVSISIESTERRLL
jgi:hypothetical protein